MAIFDWKVDYLLVLIEKTFVFDHIIGNSVRNGDIAWGYGMDQSKGNYGLNRAILPFSNDCVISFVATRQIGHR